MNSEERQYHDDVDAIYERFSGPVALGVLYFFAFLVMDVHWSKALLIAVTVIACGACGLGMWTARKIAIVTTIYAVAYLVGAVPSLQAIGGYLTRWLG